MAILHVRNVADALYEQLQQRAQEEARSLSAEVIVLPQQALAESRRSPAEILADMSRRRAKNPGDGIDSVELLREDRAR